MQFTKSKGYLTVQATEEVLLKKTAELDAYIKMINAMTQSKKSEYIQEYGLPL